MNCEPSTDCPLTLSPAELVVKLGDPSSVNCSTTVANPARLGWETEKGGTGEGNITTITWTVEKAEIWNTAPMCFITTNDNEQCNVSLAMTIYSEYNVHPTISYFFIRQNV